MAKAKPKSETETSTVDKQEEKVVVAQENTETTKNQKQMSKSEWRAMMDARNEEFKQRRLTLAAERGALVFNPEQGEAVLVLNLSQAVERIFRKNRRKDQKADIVDVKGMEAQLLFREAVVEFADKLKEAAKILGKDYREDAIVKGYRSKIPDEKERLVKIKELFGGNGSEAETGKTA
jgi:hypothetical protein